MWIKDKTVTVYVNFIKGENSDILNVKIKTKPYKNLSNLKNIKFSQWKGEKSVYLF